jgi:hypothetical protein
LSGRFDTGTPSSGAEVESELRRLRAEGARYLRSLPVEAFARPQGEKWSPADHVRHLTKSVRPLAMALGLPRFVLWLRFGRAAGASRSFTLMRETYLARLAGGATAGRFAPSPQPLPADPSAHREEVLKTWESVDAELGSRIEGWDEAALDRYRLPHPALGSLTVREMLFFTLYHNAHHLNLLASRVSAD